VCEIYKRGQKIRLFPERSLKIKRLTQKTAIIQHLKTVFHLIKLILTRFSAESASRMLQSSAAAAMNQFSQ
jgi:hypothetical protein